MDHIRVLRRALNIIWAYKALWVFGILLALTSGGGSSGGSNGSSMRGGDNGFPGPREWPRDWPREWPRDWPNMPWPNMSQEVISSIIGVAIAAVCLVLVLGVLFTMLRYVSNTALIRMVDLNESTGEKVNVRGGFRLGWTRASFRTWLVSLIFGLAGFIFVIATLLIVAAPQLLWLTGDNTAGIIGVVLSVGLFILALLLWIVVFSALSIVTELINRAIVLEGLGVFDGIRRGWALFRARLGDSVVMGLILFGINLAGTVVLIPVFIALVLGAAVIGGLPALLAGGITNIFAQGNTPQMVALLIGIPIFLLVVFAPLLWISGLWQAFTSSTWTLTFREMLTLNAVTPGAVTTTPVE